MIIVGILELEEVSISLSVARGCFIHGLTIGWISQNLVQLLAGQSRAA